MKKFICALLTSALLLTSMVMPTFAASSIDVDADAIGKMIEVFGEKMPTDPNQRIYIWKTFKAYMLDGNNGIDTIIDVLKGDKEVPEDLKPIFDKFVDGQEASYDYYILMLQIYRTTDRDARRVSLDNFGSSAAAGEEIVKTPLPVDDATAEAANNLLNSYIPDDREGDIAFHEIDATNFLNLLTPFKGEFKMTNDGKDNIVLSEEYEVSYAKLLGSTLEEYDEINSVEIDPDWTNLKKGYAALTAIAEMFNSIADEQKEDLITVLSDPLIDLYEEGLEEAEDITVEEEEEEEEESGSSSSSGSSRPYRPNRNDRDDDAFVNKEPDYEPNDLVFTDVEKDSWSAPYVVNMTKRKIFVGYEDGAFRPNVAISRQEIAVALVRAMGLEADASAAANAASAFADDAAIAPWARGYVNIAVEKGIFTGYDDGYFRGEKTISRQELATVLMRLCKDTSAKQTLNYTDANEIQDYAKAHVGRATTLGIVGGYPDGSFKPFNEVTRAEAAKMLYGGLAYFDYVNK